MLYALSESPVRTYGEGSTFSFFFVTSPGDVDGHRHEHDHPDVLEQPPPVDGASASSSPAPGPALGPAHSSPVGDQAVPNVGWRVGEVVFSLIFFFFCCPSIQLGTIWQRCRPCTVGVPHAPLHGDGDRHVDGSDEEERVRRVEELREDPHV